MLNGWVKLYRQLLGHWVTDDPDFLAVWVHMLLQANHVDKKRLFNGKVLDLKRGQLVFGLNAWARSTGVSVSKLRRMLDLLEGDNMISRQKTNKYSIISIAYYDSFQVSDRLNTGTNSNWIMLPRWLLSHKIADDSEALALWVHMLLQANYTDNRRIFNGSMVNLKKGELLYSYALMAQITNVSKMKQRRVINVLINCNLISRQKTDKKRNKYSIFSILCSDYFEEVGSQTALKPQADDTQTTVKPQSNDNTVRRKEFQEGNTVNNINTETQEKCQRAIDMLIEHYSVDRLDAETWLNNRKNIVFDRSTWELIKEESERSGISIANIAYICRVTGWKTFLNVWYFDRIKRNEDFRLMMERAGVPVE